MCLQSLMKFHHCLCKILRKNQYALCINKILEELQRAITQTELAASPYFSIVNIHLENINVCAKFDEIPSLPVKRYQDKNKKSRTDK